MAMTGDNPNNESRLTGRYRKGGFCRLSCWQINPIGDELMMLWQLMRISSIPVLLFSLFFLIAAVPVHADFYKYTDNTGAVCISNTLDAVPKQYRSTMKIVRDDSLEKKDPGARRASAAAAPVSSVQTQQAAPLLPSSGSLPSAPQQKELAPDTPSRAPGGAPASQPWRLPLMYGGAIVVIFFIIRKLAASLPSQLLTRVIYLAFFLGVFVFGYKFYAEQVVSGYFTAKTRILALFEKANRREAPPLSASQEGTQ